MLKRFLISWIVGTVSLLIIGIGAVLVVQLVGMITEWDSFVVGLGPVEVLEHTRDDSSTSAGTGIAFFPLVLIGGLLNGLGAVYFRSRSGRS
ncbi:MAG: hypothetical protein F4Y50_01300 [Dehalococcoidia bacterium]|nr:hypothetical protein [Dehalococcoidia bacterium]